MSESKNWLIYVTSNDFFSGFLFILENFMPHIPLVEKKRHESPRRRWWFLSRSKRYAECVHKLTTIRNCSNTMRFFSSIAIYYNDGKMQYLGMFHEFLAEFLMILQFGSSFYTVGGWLAVLQAKRLAKKLQSQFTWTRNLLITFYSISPEKTVENLNFKKPLKI